MKKEIAEKVLAQLTQARTELGKAWYTVEDGGLRDLTAEESRVSHDIKHLWEDVALLIESLVG